MLKKGITWLLVLVMAVSLTACTVAADKSGTADSQSAVSTSAATAEASTSGEVKANSTFLYDKLTTWKVLTPKFVNAPLKGDSLTFKEMEKRFNVRLDIDDSTNGADYTTKLNMVLASGDLPDLLIVNAVSDVSKYISQGLFQDLTTSIKKYGQDYVSEISKNDVAKKNVMTDDGKFYYFVQLNLQVDAPLYMINKPWLDKLNLPLPKTTDDLYTDLKGFKTLGNDIVPWTKGQFFSNLEYGAFIPFGTWDNFKLFPDGKYAYGPYEKGNELKAALKWLNKLYTEGLIDKEYLTLDNDSYTAKFKKGLVGFVYGYPSAPIWKTDANGKNIEPKSSDWVFIPNIKGPTGINNAYAINPTATPTFVTKNMKDPDKAVQYFDFLYTTEGKELFNFGVPGVSYNKDASGNRSYTDLILKHQAGPVNGARYNGINPNNFPFDRMIEMTSLLSPKQTYQAEVDATPFNEPSAPVLIGTPDEEKKFADIMVNVQKYVDEMIPKFITGAVSVDGSFDDFEKQLKNFKIEDAIAIKRAQFDKWNNRK